ncbi:MAG: peptidase and in kexin sedolisin [Gemmatimonadetes bacterium]|nr:peptidase and in kexin sedolisin [Gemmatimonadota bacterium]
MRKYALPAALVGGLMSCSDLPTAPLPEHQLSSPSGTSRDVSPVPIPGQYIVRFRSNGASAPSNAAIVRSLYGGSVDRVYVSAINGAAMHLADDAAAALRADPRIASVEQDEVISIASTTQLGATWGLDRLDQRALPLGNSYVYGANGSGVTVYIIDSGINFAQADFGGRAVTGYDAITLGGTATDCLGHGSHVAGTVGSTTYGVAKNVRLVAVRVLDCNGNGSSSSVLAGIDWVTTNKTLPAVANMSIGAGTNATVNQAVQNSIAAGITYAVSAGNNSTDACLQSPASAVDALTVGATDSGDSFAGYSNFGNCVDLLAPGTNVTSWWTGTGSNTVSGTSMSSPHVAGAAALYLQVNPAATPAQVRAALVGNATPGIIAGVPSGTPNLLLYTGFIQLPSAPVANFASSCISTACSFDAGNSTSSWATPAYQWNFGDASSGSGKTPTHTYAAAGTYAVTLTITDPNGTSSKTANLVINRAPTATIATPAANASFVQGAPVTFTGTGTDPEDGALSGTSLVWSSSRDGVMGIGPSLTTTSLSAGTHTVTLTAKDAQNATGIATVAITIAANRAPTASITTPANGAVFLLGTSVTFSGAGNDVEDGTLTGVSLVWTSSIDGPLGTGASVTTSSPSAGTHTITLTSKDSHGATGVSSVSLKINQAPVATITAPASAASFAPGTPVSFAGTATDPEDGVLTGSALVWTSSRDGQIGTGIAFSTSTLTTGAHTITLTARDVNGASHTASRSITIATTNTPPVAHFTVSCPTSQCTLDASASADNVGIVKYAWTWGDGRSENKVMPITKNTWAITGVYTITLTVSDAGGLTNTISKQVAVPDLAPVVTIIAPVGGNVFPQGAPVTFAGAATDFEDGTLAGSALQWSSSVNGPLGNGATISTSALTPGTHTITLTATDALGVVGTATRTITIVANQSPSAVIASPANNSTYLLGSSVSFAGAASDPEDGTLSGASLVWTSSRDGRIGTGSAISTSTLSAGLHTVTLTATDSRGATRVATISVMINRAPSANISSPAANATIVAGTSVTFSGSASDPEDGPLNGASLVWASSRDGQIGTGASFTTTTLSVGAHTITLTAKDSVNATAVATRSITIVSSANHAPVASFTMTCPTLNCPADASSSADDAGIVSYSWDWGNGKSKTVTLPTTTTTFLTPGVYTVTLTVKDAGGLTNTMVKQIAVGNQSPSAIIASPANNASFTQGVVVTLSGSATDPEDGVLAGAALAWRSSRDGVIGTGATFSTSSLSLGTHVVSLIASDGQSASDTATVTVTIVANQPPIATIATPANGATFAAGSNVNFTGAASDLEDGTLGGASLVWTSSIDGQIGVGSSLSTSALSTGTHIITLTAKDSRNASGVATLTVIINARPSAIITSPANNTTTKQGVPVSFSGSGSDPEDGALSGASLVWTSSRDGQIGTGAVIVTPSLTLGTHTITLTARDSKGATAIATMTLTINLLHTLNRPPTVSISAPATSSTFALGTSITFTGSGTDPEDGVLNGASLVWTSDRDGQIGTGTSFTKSNLSAGVHTITLTGRDAQNLAATFTRVITIQ